MGKNEMGSPMNAANPNKVDVEFGVGDADLSRHVKKMTNPASQNLKSQQEKREKDMRRQL
ncbi:MAG TPA: hypothetical protein DCY20_01320 [Firmicutes bacterium]|nr:hypothetical protein [Bacillota bacterium]